MHLDPRVKQILESYAEGIPFAVLSKAVASLSDHYRAHKPTATAKLDTSHWMAAYLLTRFPATYAVAAKALNELTRCLPEGTITSSLDLGAGAGAASLAASELLPSLSEMTMLESQPRFLDVARELLPNAECRASDITAMKEYPKKDLILSAYVLSELSATNNEKLIEKAWKAAEVTLVLIEPGSTDGFSRILKARQQLLELGANMVAPCPNYAACPMPAGDWCHFAARLERSALHRKLKQGQLSYEDEKFSYLIVSRTPALLSPARIVRRPVHHPGRIELVHCSNEALHTQQVFKRDKEKFRAARHAEWGDQWHFAQH